MQNVLTRVLAIQVAACLACGLIFLSVQDVWTAGSAVCGGMIGILTSLLLAWRMTQAARPGADLRALFIGAFERMVLAVAAFGVGIALIGLAPFAMIMGFASTQVAYYAGAGPLRRVVVTDGADSRKDQ